MKRKSQAHRIAHAIGDAAAYVAYGIVRVLEIVADVFLRVVTFKWLDDAL